MFIVLEQDEDGTPEQWRTLFRTLDEATSAVEAQHEALWAEAYMEGDSALEPMEHNEQLFIGLADENTRWRSWTITEVKEPE